MALTNRERLERAFGLLVEGLGPVVEDVMTALYNGPDWNEKWAEHGAYRHGGRAQRLSKTDPLTLLKAVTENSHAFAANFTHAQVGYAAVARDARNKWAHMEPQSSEDTDRALVAIEQVLRAADAPDSADDVHRLLVDLRRTVFSEQDRQAARRVKPVSLATGSTMKPWREVIRPHRDVAQGNFSASEYAADLHLVALGQASPEYQDPRQFFERTFLTDGLRDLLSRAVRRMDGDANASPVVNLQTNFGGGKTHSMLALYHLFGRTSTLALPQEVQELTASAGVRDASQLGVRRAVLVGTKIPPKTPSNAGDRPGICTLWGELAWQLGGAESYGIVAEADRSHTNPGDLLRQVIERAAPCLILIDEWVAYARELVGRNDLPAGTFDTQFTFAQQLTEAVSAVPKAMLVVSIPASDDHASGIEVGGTNGQEALRRLQNVVRRVADQWRPADRDESFEIVRRRLFEAPDAAAMREIDATARRFVSFYADNAGRFPQDAEQHAYERRIERAYPFHPELLDRLYEDWSTLERFQRTRGVLALLSTVVHALWASEDASPLILPGNVPLDDARVNAAFTQYLEDRWKPVITTDVDGGDSTAQTIDQRQTFLGRRHVTRRLARAVLVGAAPRARRDRRGIDRQHLWLGVATPDDQIGNFGAATDSLAQQATYFYEDQGRYWFDTQPSVAKTARDNAEAYRERPEEVWKQIVERLDRERKRRGRFAAVQVAPAGSGDIPDTEDLRLVIVHPRSRHERRNVESAAMVFATRATAGRGDAGRVNRNRIVFAAADADAEDSLEDAVRAYLGWRDVVTGPGGENLSKQLTRQAERQVQERGAVVDERLASAYAWVLVPEQDDPTKPFTLREARLEGGQGSLPERVSARLEREGDVVPVYGTANIVPEIRERLGDTWSVTGYVSVGDLWAYMCRFPYLERLVDRDVLVRAVRGANSSALTGDGLFALASGYDAQAKRFTGLVLPDANAPQVAITDATLLVRGDLARAQAEAQDERRAEPPAVPSVSPLPPDQGGGPDAWKESSPQPVTPPAPPDVSRPTPMRRFFGAVDLDVTSAGHQFTEITQEVVDHLLAPGTTVKLHLEVEATRPAGFSPTDIRVVDENAATLRFADHGFDRE